LLIFDSLLDDLDEDLLLELDQVVRDNQLARCPFAKSERADLLLHERHPELAEDIDEERQRRVKAMAFKLNQRDDEKKLSTSLKTRYGSLDDFAALSPLLDRSRRKSKATRNEPFSPYLRPKDSQADLIFDMDDEESSSIASPLSPSPRPLDPGLRNELDELPTLAESWRDSKGRPIQESETHIASPSAGGVTPVKSPSEFTRRVSQGGNPWGSAVLPTSRLGLGDIISESKSSESALSASLAAEKKQAAKLTPQKMSQKERKKYLQQQAEEAARQESQAAQQPQTPWINPAEKKGSPWQSTPVPPKTSMKDALGAELKASSLAPPDNRPGGATNTSSMAIPRRAASPDTRFSGQNRSGSGTPRGNTSGTSGKATPVKTGSSQTTPVQATRPESKPVVPHSKSYIPKQPRHGDSEIGLGLADIIGQQKREQESVKEAVAKRSLQEIQQEQAFQEWWDQESRRTQEEEARQAARDKTKEEKRQGSSRRGKSGKSKGGANRERDGAVAVAPHAEAAGGSGSSRGRARGSRGGKP
jgi:hypothetical protein